MESESNAAAVDRICINTIRTLTMDAVEAAGSGHPGAPMGMAPAAYVLWTRFLKHNPKNPDWPDRDRFILSGGHASMLLYSLLHMTGYDLSLDDIKAFRQWGSKTPGHPEYGRTPGVETTTGPLGQGVANAVGMALAEKSLAARFNRPGYPIVDHYTYLMCGDGDLMEGISYEAFSLAGHLGLSKLICLYDDNSITIEGSTEITFTEDVDRRFESMGWQVLTVTDVNDTAAVESAIAAARLETEKPSLIRLKSYLAFGSPNKQGSPDAHGAPLGEAEVRLTKKILECPEDECFLVSESSLTGCRACVMTGGERESEWDEMTAAYKKEYPAAGREWTERMNRALPAGWDEDLPVFSPKDGPVATRSASGAALNALAEKIPALMGGSADLAPSNKTIIQSSHDFQKESTSGRNIRFGVREHAMAGILSGMALHKGIIPYGGTFLVFADYMRPAMRCACLMNLPVIYVFTHDSISVGEDGPTHQPVEHLAGLRLMPGMTVIRPADANETVVAWKLALRLQSPAALILSRQKLPVIDRSYAAGPEGVEKGAYVVSEATGPVELIIMATGAEVHDALAAQTILAEGGVSARVVNMPSWELFEQQPQSYKESVLPPEVTPRLAVEAGAGFGWERYVGDRGETICMTTYGASAPGAVLREAYGFTPEHIAARARTLLERG